MTDPQVILQDRSPSRVSHSGREQAAGHALAIDLGTHSTQIYAVGRGIVLSEPSLAAVDRESGLVVAVGWGAGKALRNDPARLEPVRPLRRGVVADFEVAEQILSYFLHKVRRRVYGVYGRVFGSLLKPKVLVCVPAGATSLELSTAKRVALAAGARKARTMEGPLAAAIGAGNAVDEMRGSMIVDVGGGKTEAAIISMGEIVAGTSVRTGGDDLDAAIRSHVRKEFVLSIDLQEAERLKIELGSALPLEEVEFAEVSGLDLLTRDSKTILVSTEEAHDAMKGCVATIAETVRATFENTPAELVADVAEGGIVLCGGGTRLRLLEDLLRYKVGVPVSTAKEPVRCAAVGAGRTLGGRQ
ncbi:MAG: rod shape-determining protein [Rubrobacteraceae bacterium]